MWITFAKFFSKMLIFDFLKATAKLGGAQSIERWVALIKDHYHWALSYQTTSC